MDIWKQHFKNLFQSAGSSGGEHISLPSFFHFTCGTGEGAVTAPSLGDRRKITQVISHHQHWGYFSRWPGTHHSIPLFQSVSLMNISKYIRDKIINSHHIFLLRIQCDNRERGGGRHTASSSMISFFLRLLLQGVLEEICQLLLLLSPEDEDTSTKTDQRNKNYIGNDIFR